ncbi:homeobox-leucine zipper protein ROC5 isoform X3 [Beta vulgaris subsp. vulgaris]|nr:homeobox-leucine zipper protein ROC5 isoform X3 [Beta vulgaris subsp. vulgaris]
MEGQEEMGFYGDQFDTNNIIGREKEDSGSDNYDTVSVEDVPEGASQIKVKGRRKRYHRHTPQQIQELENFFKNCAHPDEKQRLEIGRRLGLESRQVKFWFQNRRTQLKTQMERHENVVLKQEYDKLRIENIAIKDAMRSPLCQSCGGPAMLGELSMDQHHLRVENSRLKDELTRVCALAERFLGKPITDVVGPISLPGSNSSLELSMGRGGLSGFMSSPASLPMGHNLENGVSSNSTMTNSMSGPVSTEYEKTMFMQAAMAAMDELLAMAQTDSPLWFKGLDDGKELLNHEEYLKKFSGFIGMRPCGFITDASRETGSVFITSSELVDTMMFPRRWQDMFPCTISKATTVEVLFNGAGGNRDGELQLMNAEFVFPSPFVPFRQEKILRYCKQHSEGMWAVVDVSVDMIREPSFSGSSIKSRRLPSGCIVQDVANGYSLVTWIEHVEYDENCIHQLYRPLLRSGMAFGAQRWLATLQRERDCAAIFMSSRIFPEDTTVGAVTQEGRRSILKLMRRISNNFCSGLCASSACRWEKLQVGGLGADVCVMSRVSIDEPGEPSGVVLSASTSVWLPVTRQHLFDFLKDEKLRGKWDILANGGPMEVIARLSKSHDGNNCVALLCPPAAPARESNMLILQESWTDRTSSFIVYAPVDSTSMESVLRGGDSDYLALLPSGFAIADAAILPNVLTLANDNGDGGGTGGRGASALTLGFQILVNSLPTAKLTVESINTVNDLMSCTIQKIRDSLGVN